MEKTLYISDLDGTLLNTDAQVSPYTEKIINKLLDKGLNFTIASARGSSVFNIIKNLKIKTPFVLMNGVLIYDPVIKSYVKNEIFNSGTLNEIISVLNSSALDGHYFFISDENTAVNSETNEAYDFNKNINRKAFDQENKILPRPDEAIFYFSMLDTREKLEPVYETLKAFTDIKIEYYFDVYTKDKWFFEIFDIKASKYTAIEFLRKNYGFEKVISFGDNYNDLPMFRASDECYATKNAFPEVKRAANAIIGSNTENGVANWLLENVKL